MMDRVPTNNGPTGHDLPMCLQSTFETYAPLWARLAGDGWLDEPEMRSVKKTIADLEKYNAYHVEIDDAWVKLSVADCVALEAARLAGKASLDLHGHCFDFVTRTAAGDAYISFATSSDGTDVRVRWSPYRVQREGGEKGDFYSRVELLENTKDQLDVDSDRLLLSTGTMPRSHAQWLGLPGWFFERWLSPPIESFCWGSVLSV